ncbi:MAG: cysteine desulfurase family protein [Gemmataceae bacterium]
MPTTPIYLDHNSTTPLLPAARDALLAALDAFGNPASLHAMGRQARRALEDAREEVAHLLHAQPDEVLFTSGATEANNLALHHVSGPIALSPVEHPSVTAPLEKADLRLLHVQTDGIVPLDDVPPDCTLVVCQLANHETGAVHPVRPIGKPWHCDAVQAVGKIPVDFAALGVTTLALSAHKFHGPKGIGALLVRRGHVLAPLFRGGHQQQGRRPGTESPPLAVSLAVALRHALQEREARTAHLRRLRTLLLEPLTAIGGVINGPADGLPHTLNISFPGVKSDALLIGLDLAGVACSAGSACSSGSLLPSAVLRAMQVPRERLHSAIRLSLGFEQSEEEVREAARRICQVVKRLRHGEASGSGHEQMFRFS